MSGESIATMHTYCGLSIGNIEAKDEINSVLGIELPEGNEFETIAGFILDQAGRIVEEGESIVYENINIAVEEVDNTRILKVLITLPEEE